MDTFSMTRAAIFFLLSTTIFSLKTVAQETDSKMVNGHNLIRVNGKLGLLSAAGDTVITPGPYRSITYFDVHEEFANDPYFDAPGAFYQCFKENEFEVWYEETGKVESDWQFTGIEEAYDETIIIVSPEGKGIIFKEKLLVPPVYDKIEIEAESVFGCCLNYIVSKAGKKGIYTDYGLMIEPNYEKISPSESFYGFLVVENEKRQGLLYVDDFSPGSKLVLPPQYDEFGIFENSEDLIRLKKDKLFGLARILEDSVEILLTPEYTGIEVFADDYFDYYIKVVKDDLFGIYNPENDSLLMPVICSVKGYKKPETLGFGSTMIINDKKNKSYVILDLADGVRYFGAEKIEYRFEEQGALIFLNKNGKFQLLTTDYEFNISPLEFTEYRVRESDEPEAITVLAIKHQDKWITLDQYNGAQWERSFDSFEELIIAFDNTF